MCRQPEATMPIIREIVFLNRRAYSMPDTIRFMHDMFSIADDDEFPVYVYESILAVLHDAMYLVEMDPEEFIPDPHTGVLTLFDLWLERWGCTDRTVDHFLGDNATVDTYPCDADGDSVFEESITSDDEDEMVIGAHILLTMEDIDDEMRDLLDEEDTERIFRD